MVDGVAGDGEEARVAAEEGNIGSVEGCDNAKTGIGFGQSCEKGGNGMGEGVVGVDKVEFHVIGQVGNGRGRVQRIERSIEEGILKRRNFVVNHVW